MSRLPLHRCTIDPKSSYENETTRYCTRENVLPFVRSEQRPKCTMYVVLEEERARRKEKKKSSTAALDRAHAIREEKVKSQRLEATAHKPG